MKKVKKPKPQKPKYAKACRKSKGCSSVSEEFMLSNMSVIAGRNCGKGCHRKKSWETMTGKSFESRLAA